MARYFLAFSEKQYHVSFQRILKKFNFSFLPLWFWLVQVRLYEKYGFENTSAYYKNPLPNVVYMEKCL